MVDLVSLDTVLRDDFCLGRHNLRMLQKNFKVKTILHMKSILECKSINVMNVEEIIKEEIKKLLFLQMMWKFVN